MTGARAWRGWALRAAGSAAILAAIFWVLPMEAVAEGFARLPLSLFLGVLGLFLLGHCAAAAKWWMLLDRAVAFPLALRAHFAGLAANLCLPGVAGGDAVRAALVHGAMRDGARLAAGAVADRLIDMLALAVLALAGIAALSAKVAGLATILVLLGLLLAALAASIFVLPGAIRWAWGRFSLPARGLALRLAEAFGLLAARPGRLAVALAASLTIQALFVLLTVRLATVIGVEAPLAAWVFAWPLAKLLAVLPVSLGGLGLREATLAALIAPFGAAAAGVVAAGLVWQAVLFAAGALGGLVWLATGSGAALPRNGPMKPGAGKP